LGVFLVVEKSAFTETDLNANSRGNVFPLGGQTGKIVGEGGEVAIDRGGAATRFVRRRIFQSGGQFPLLPFQCGDFHLEFVQALFFFALCFGNRIARFSSATNDSFSLMAS
jgi:hypothetical protein